MESIGDFSRAEVATVVAPGIVTRAVAAFPDAPSERPEVPADPALELLAENPYDRDLVARKAAENLYGTDLDAEDPYADDLRLADNPYASRVMPEPELDNPYAATRLAGSVAAEPDLSNPYARRPR